MSAFRLGAGLAIAMTIAWVPLAAQAKATSPPGNSAVDQYSETFPAAGGSGPTKDGGHRAPAEVLGARDARRLEALGSNGRAAAALAAATAPSRSAAGRLDGRGRNGVEADEPGGSSGLSEIVGQATGSSSSGEAGLLLPLVIVGAALWSIAYIRRRRGRAV